MGEFLKVKIFNSSDDSNWVLLSAKTKTFGVVCSRKSCVYTVVFILQLSSKGY
jgi:hypothetical protein